VAGTATVNVIIGNVTVQARPDPLPKGFQTQLFLNNGSTDSNNNPVVNSDITWSTSNPAIVSVNPTTGVITATALGSAVITALSRTDNQSTGSTTIVVNEPLVAGGARIGHNTELGVPTDADPSDDKLIVRRQYTTSYNPTRGVTNWVSWNLDATHKGGLARCNCMTADTALVRLGFPAYDTNDWVNNGQNGQYSRGHMSPSADWNVSNGDNAATFFLTNMLPQNQDQNGGPWGAFEDYLRTRATGSTEIYIVSGGIFTRDRRGAGIDGFGTISNAGKIAIPDSVWKIAVIVPDARDASGIVNPGDVEVIVINTPNEKPAAGAVWNDYATTIDKIQQSTGYDFLSALPQKVQCRLEARNCGPSAVIAGGGVAGGSEGQTLDFTAAASTDPEGDALSYRWEINGQPAGSGATLSHLFGNDGAYQVRLIVADAGSADTTTTTVSIANVSPAVNAFSGGSIAEGATFATSGSFTDPGMDQWAATVDYGDGSGVQPLALVGNSFSLGHRYADNGTYTVTVTVSELGVASATGSNVATVTVANVPPQVAAFLGATILRGETYGAAGTFGDPGAADTWTARVVYGDGSAAAPLAVSGMGFQLGHLYSTAGDFTVLVTITDKDGDAGTASARVVVQTTTQGMATLGDMVVALAASSGSLNGSQLASLRALVTAGLSHFQRQNPKAAVAQLNAFVNVLNALVKSGKVTGAQAAPLIEYAGRLIASAGV
jgi:DNA/RNA endonuclease G (NUC1)